MAEEEETRHAAAGCLGGADAARWQARRNGSWRSCSCNATRRPPSSPAPGSFPAAPASRRTARASTASAPARSASCRRRPGSSSPPTRRWSPSAASSPPRSCRAASTPGFFLALAPAHTPPEIDGAEIVDARWFRPAVALASADAGGVGLATSRPASSSAGWPNMRLRTRCSAPTAGPVGFEPLIPEIISEVDETGRLPGIADSQDITSLVQEFRRLGADRRGTARARRARAPAVGVDAALVHLPLDPPEQLAGVFQRQFQFFRRCARAGARGTTADGR